MGVKVEAGINLAALNTELEARGYSLNTMLSAISYQSVAGAVATGSHGSGQKKLGKSIASGLVSMDIMRLNASVMTLQRGDALFNAASVGLGFCGILVNV